MTIQALNPFSSYSLRLQLFLVIVPSRDIIAHGELSTPEFIVIVSYCLQKRGNHPKHFAERGTRVNTSLNTLRPGTIQLIFRGKG